MKNRIAADVTVMVLAYNEAPNIGRCLERLRWAKRVLMIDSGSTDTTLEIARRFNNVDILHRPFDDFASQCNFGLAAVTTPWVLSLDADYELSQGLIEELSELAESGAVGYSARFKYRIYGRQLRASLYPPRVVLYRTAAARYRNEGHGHRVVVNGNVAKLSGEIYHDDRKPLSRWLASQLKYAKAEADHLLSARATDLRRTDRIRLLAWPAPVLVFFYTLIVKRCVLDGWAGWLYVLQRTFAEVLVAIELVDRKLRRDHD